MITPEQRAQALGIIAAYCGWSLPLADRDELLDSSGGQLLTLPALHVTAVTTVTVDEQPIGRYTWSAMGAMHRRAGWPRGYRRVRVAYTAGYDPLPPEIEAVITTLTANPLPPPGVTSEARTAGALSRTLTYDSASATGITGVTRLVLDRYRLPETA